MLLHISVRNNIMLPNITFAFIWIMYFAIEIDSQTINDLFFKAAGSSVSELNADCSFSCDKLSNKMVEMMIGF